MVRVGGRYHIYTKQMDTQTDGAPAVGTWVGGLARVVQAAGIDG